MKNKKYININSNSYEYGWVYKEIEEFEDSIKVENESTFAIDIHPESDLKELSNIMYKQIVDAKNEGDDKLELELKNSLLSRIENILYCERLEKYDDYYSVCDEYLESSVTFKDMHELTIILLENPEYFTNEILISAYYLVCTGKLIEAKTIINQIIDAVIEKKECIYNLTCFSKFMDIIVTTNNFLSFTINEQLNFIADLIKIESLNCQA